MVARTGHSLAELIVAMVILGVALSGFAAASRLSRDLARNAIRLEDDAARATFILDSLAAHASPGPGASTRDRTRFEWIVTPMPGGWSRLVVTATDSSTGAAIAELTGSWAPSLPRALVP